MSRKISFLIVWSQKEESERGLTHRAEADGASAPDLLY
jgi:hypothetical protein